MATQSIKLSIALPIPGGQLGNYPERPIGDADESFFYAMSRRFDRGYSAVSEQIAVSVPRKKSKLRFAKKVADTWPSWPESSTPEFTERLKPLRANLAARGLTQDLQIQVLSAVTRCVYDVLRMTPHPVQYLAASALLQRKLVEMATGEGKTLAVFLAAASAALAGVPVHVLTANSYLAIRDQEAMQACVSRLGLSSGTIQTKMTRIQRHVVYQCGIVYATASELIFDYLNDRADARAGRPRILSGLCMAIVDEADSVLLDEARTPFVLAYIKNDPQLNLELTQALLLAKNLSIPADLTIDRVHKQAKLTESGRNRVFKDCQNLSGLWSSSSRYRHEFVERAASALYAMHKEVDYVISENEIQIVDQNTGRVAHGRRWSMGLHQLIELKEGLDASGDQVTRAQLTFQRFFPRYHHLCGISGTLRESSGELRKIYRCGITYIEPRLPCRRVHRGPKVYLSESIRLQALIERVKLVRSLGRPILIGTDSVSQSDAVAGALTEAKIPVTVLNAREHAVESRIVSGAGLARCVTVTTNMAGRGTDIGLTPSTLKSGGLHVISLQSNSSVRIDRQLAGRSARQGDPGSYEVFANLSDGLILRHLPLWLIKLATLCSVDGACLPFWLGQPLLAFCQAIETRLHKQQRKQMQLADEATEKQLSFCGESA